MFAVLEVLPGDPARLMLGMNASAEQVEQLRTQMGLNDPLLLRYLHWAGGILRLDFGRSYTYSVPVIDLVRERVIVSLPLALIALALSTAIALPVGLYAASRHGRMGDMLAMGATQFGVAVPNFWFALLLVYLFAVWLRWVPAGGFPGWSAGVGPALKALALPAVALALPQAAILARVTRSALIEVMNEDYIRTARAKGTSERAVVWRHGMRAVLTPLVTQLGADIALLLGGAIVIEQVYGLQGVGALAVQAVNNQDRPIIIGVVLLGGVFIVVANIIVDLFYVLLDPRVR